MPLIRSLRFEMSKFYFFLLDASCSLKGISICSLNLIGQSLCTFYLLTPIPHFLYAPLSLSIYLSLYLSLSHTHTHSLSLKA